MKLTAKYGFLTLAELLELLDAQEAVIVAAQALILAGKKWAEENHCKAYETPAEYDALIEAVNRLERYDAISGKEGS